MNSIHEETKKLIVQHETKPWSRMLNVNARSHQVQVFQLLFWSVKLLPLLSGLWLTPYKVSLVGCGSSAFDLSRSRIMGLMKSFIPPVGDILMFCLVLIGFFSSNFRPHSKNNYHRHITPRLTTAHVAIIKIPNKKQERQTNQELGYKLNRYLWESTLMCKNLYPNPS